MKEKLKLYSYWRSSCGHRVRITLSLKDFMKINPMGTVPALVDGEVVITDSFAIIMMRSNPEPPLLPRDLHKRALNYQVSFGSRNTTNCMHTTKRYIEEKTNGEEKIAWVNNAIRKGYTDGPKRNNVIDRLDYPIDRSRISNVPRNVLGKSCKFFYKRIDRWIYVRKRIDRSLRWTKA
ncbi:hypothetical protein YC2023_019322 [Brassica napus]